MIVRTWACVMTATIVAGMFVWGCGDGPESPSLDQIVVRGYLFAGEPVRDVQLTASVLIGASDTTGPPISDASVTLQRNGVSYILVSDKSRSGYYVYQGNDLVVTSGDRFHLEAVRGEVHVTASTTVPTKPQALKVSRDTLVVHVRTIFGNFQQVYSNDSLVVRWGGSDNELYYTVMTNIESTPQRILSDSLPGFGFMSQPTSQLQYSVPVQNIKYVGRYIVRVYKVNQEYADLYRSRQQDTRSLNEPLTNVLNGLGVFSAFACDSVAVYIRLK
jgi:hypothetical protein